MPPRNLNIIVLAFCISLLCYFTHRRARTAIHVGDALELIHTYYVDPVDQRELLAAAMDGMTSKLDAHSEYIPAQEFESFQDNIDQEFAGIGIFVEQPPEGPPVRVVTPLVGSPALQAGMRPGDAFLQINDEDVSTLPLPEISARLKGPVGTTVDVVVRRGEQDVELRVQRATIELESVIGDYRDQQDHWVYRLREDPNIAYVRLTGFGEKTVRELDTVLTELNNEFAALVFDLRGNGGGLLDTAVEVSDMFLESGEIVSTRTRGGILEEQFHAEPGSLVAADKPIAVLVDGNSASASEIVAACLQDNSRAVVVGTQTYGKGTVQNVMPLQYGRSALRLTVARFYRPSGENLDRGKAPTTEPTPNPASATDASEAPASGDATTESKWGVQPDSGLQVELDDETRDRLEKRWRDASYPSLSSADDETTVESSLQVDPQLQRAVEYLREQLPDRRPAPAAA